MSSSCSSSSRRVWFVTGASSTGDGFVGAAEEVSENEAREQLDTNFFGALWCGSARPSCRTLRERRSGHIVQISTVGAVGSMPTFGMYNASKWALEGFSEALAAEVAPGGVRVTIAELGGFATDCAWSSMRFAICPTTTRCSPMSQLALDSAFQRDRCLMRALGSGMRLHPREPKPMPEPQRSVVRENHGDAEPVGA
jgi:NAD(P)-dependent dehydrogenase (short-subunit alcohol dehydrogenase family)